MKGAAILAALLVAEANAFAQSASTDPAQMFQERCAACHGENLPTDAVFAGSLDGHVRAHAIADGRVLWDYDTSGEHTTVNGIRAIGGSINGPGPTIAGGMVFVNSGYQLFGRPGNVLLAFGVE